MSKFYFILEYTVIDNFQPTKMCIFAQEHVFLIFYRNWYQYWGHCYLINDLGSSPQPEGEARELWLASQVVNETTMTKIAVSISILSWWNQIKNE